MFHIESYKYELRGWLFPRVHATFRLSTIELPGDYGYETCVFNKDESSDVIESYKTLDEAIVGHYHHAKYYGCNTIKLK